MWILRQADKETEEDWPARQTRGQKEACCILACDVYSQLLADKPTEHALQYAQVNMLTCPSLHILCTQK